MPAKGLTVHRLKTEDLGLTCPEFAPEGNPELKIFSSYGMIFPDGVENKPLYIFRHSNFDSWRWAGIMDMADTPGSYQKGGRAHEIAQHKDPVDAPYGVLCADPLTYGMKGSGTEIEYSTADIHIKEGNGDILDITATPFPLALFDAGMEMGTNFIHSHLMFEGTYNGKPVEGMGCFDRSYVGDIAKVSFANLMYFFGAYSCVRADGRKESFYTQLNKKNGSGTGIYWLEGEEPVIAKEIWLDAEWEKYPYAPDDDPTVVYKDAVWRFADKEIHFEGKWGSKGFTPQPRLDRVGQSHCYGTWYAGNTPYKHVTWNTFNENMEATDERIRSLGFEVID